MVCKLKYRASSLRVRSSGQFPTSKKFTSMSKRSWLEHSASCVVVHSTVHFMHPAISSSVATWSNNARGADSHKYPPLPYWRTTIYIHHVQILTNLLGGGCNAVSGVHRIVSGAILSNISLECLDYIGDVMKSLDYRAVVQYFGFRERSKAPGKQDYQA